MKKEKLKELYWKIYRSVKGFNLTKYLLDRKEEKLEEEITNKRDEIEFFEGQIKRDEKRIIDSGACIVIKEIEIKALEINISKIIKVINLYID